MLWAGRRVGGIEAGDLVGGLRRIGPAPGWERSADAVANRGTSRATRDLRSRAACQEHREPDHE